jgi:Type II secretion system (T2SS), protein E, N-terminal domain
MKFSLESFRSIVDRGWKSMHSVCALRTCRHTMLIRSSPHPRVGVQVGLSWYCSVDCFAEAALIRLTELWDQRVVEMPHRPRHSIGLIMLSKDYLTAEQLRQATLQSQLRDEELEVALLRLGFANERQVAAARAAQWGCPVMKQERVGLPVEVDVPPAILRAFSAVPLHYAPNGGRLLIGFVHRMEHSLLHALEQMMGCRAEPCFITPTEFEAQLPRVTGVPDCQEVVFEEMMTPTQMAKTLGGLAIEVAAREVRFVHCKDYIWTRLFGKQRRVDVLFRARYEPPVEKSENFLFEEQNIGTWG